MDARLIKKKDKQKLSFKYLLTALRILLDQ